MGKRCNIFDIFFFFFVDFRGVVIETLYFVVRVFVVFRIRLFFCCFGIFSKVVRQFLFYRVGIFRFDLNGGRCVCVFKCYLSFQCNFIFYTWNLYKVRQFGILLLLFCVNFSVGQSGFDVYFMGLSLLLKVIIYFDSIDKDNGFFFVIKYSVIK